MLKKFICIMTNFSLIVIQPFTFIPAPLVVVNGEDNIQNLMLMQPTESHRINLIAQGRNSVVRNAGGVAIALRGCGRLEGVVTSLFLVQNNRRQDTTFTLYSGYRYNNPSRIITSSGQEYAARGVGIGRKFENTTQGYTALYVSNKLVTGIPTRAIMTFGSVPRNENFIAALIVGFEAGDSRRDIVQGSLDFRNIRIQ